MTHKIFNTPSPQIMGILNITPNSFSRVGRFMSHDDALKHAEKIFHEGASIIDVGGEPTNPGVHPITTEQEELDRVIPIVEAIAREFPITISIDTSKPKVMKEAIAKGASMINDVRALRYPGSMEVIAETGVAVCLMHMLHPDGKPSESSAPNLEPDPIPAIKTFLEERVATCLSKGILREKIIIDPGIGHGSFGKTQQQNLQILNRLEEFQEMGFPILIGVSRKTFIGEILNLPAEERLYGSLAATVIAVTKGASIIRTHDVKETLEVAKVAWAILNVP